MTTKKEAVAKEETVAKEVAEAIKKANTPRPIGVYQKLAVLKSKVPYLQKDTKAYKFKYVNEDQLNTALRPHEEELGLMFVPKGYEYKESAVDVIKGKTIVSYVAGIIEYLWIDTEIYEDKSIPTELSIVLPFGGEQADISQAVGSGLTYIGRYAKLKSLGIATAEDDPDARVQPVKAEPKVEKPMNKEEMLKYINGFKLPEARMTKMVAWVNGKTGEEAKTVEELTETALSLVCHTLKGQ